MPLTSVLELPLTLEVPLAEVLLLEASLEEAPSVEVLLVEASVEEVPSMEASPLFDAAPLLDAPMVLEVSSLEALVVRTSFEAAPTLFVVSVESVELVTSDVPAVLEASTVFEVPALSEVPALPELPASFLEASLVTSPESVELSIVKASVETMFVMLP